jgi:uncharacterized protein (DUF433 family)
MIWGRIEIDPRVCGGTPVIKGTRIPVAVILDQLREDVSWESILEGYPALTAEDIRAAIDYAKSSVEHSELVEVAVEG